MTTEQDYCDIPESTPLTDIKLPYEWVVYLYDKQSFKKMVNKPNYKAKPYTEICTLRTVNDLIYILQLMEIPLENNITTGSKIGGKRNLDANDYIIMKKGIEPIWEDPRNSNGGTFSIKMNHSKGYDVWMTFMMYMLGNTLSDEMEQINGITASFIPDSNNFNGTNGSTGPQTNYAYIKIWDGKEGRTRDDFVNILPHDLLVKIKGESLMYSQNNKKKDFGGDAIISQIQKQKAFDNRRNTRGGFRKPFNAGRRN